MFCPQCRTDYREGYTECADCRVPLAAQLPAVPQGGETDLATRKWELDRRDSLNIAWVKGALIGLATAEVLAAIANYGLRQLFFPGGFIRGPGAPSFVDLWFPVISMLRPIGIVLGGYLGQNWRR